MCSDCIAGKFGAFDDTFQAGVCEHCPAGWYQDAAGATKCTPCPPDTFGGTGTGLAALSDCAACANDFVAHTTTGGRASVAAANGSSGCKCAKANTNSSNAAAARGYFMLPLQAEGTATPFSCEPCPDGASCFADGLILAQIAAKPGFWRPSPSSQDFSSCATGIATANADEAHGIARRRCCPGNLCRNTTFTVSDDQCAKGHAGALCLACAAGYVQRGVDCVACPGGASASETFGYLVLCVVVPVFVLCFVLFVCSSDANETKASAAHEFVGQLKILLAFVQILTSLPAVLGAVPWPEQLVSMAFPLSFAANLDILSVFAVNQCRLAVDFFRRFLLHMSLPPLLATAIVGAWRMADVCRKPKGTHGKQHRFALMLKFIIFTILLMCKLVVPVCENTRA